MTEIAPLEEWVKIISWMIDQTSPSYRAQHGQSRQSA
jgi:hypothetical protein